MSKVRIRISEKRTIDLSLPQIRKKDLVYDVLNLTQLITGFVFVFLLARTTILSKVQYTDIFEIFVGTLVILFAAQLLKGILSGVRFFPESKFDLAGLLFAIGLISTLLLKQILDLAGNEGMLPNQSAWHYTIVGFLLMLFGGYLFDVSFRKKFSMKNILIGLLVSVEVLAIGKYIVDGEVFTSIAYLIFVLLPVFVGFGFDIKNYYYRGLYFVNLVLVGLLGFLNLDMELALIYLLGVLIVLVVGFVRKDFRIKDIRSLVNYKKGALRFRYEGSAFYVVVNAVIGFVIALVVVLNLLFSDRTLSLIRSGMEDNLDVFRGVKFVELIIGGGFDLSSQSFLGNIFSSYGLLGLMLVAIYFGAVIVAVRGLGKKEKSTSMLTQGLFGSFVLYGLLSLFFNYSMQVLIVFFFLAGLVANLYAKEGKKTVNFEYVKVNVLKKEWQRVAVRVAQSAIILLVLVGGIYTLFNIGDMFLS